MPAAAVASATTDAQRVAGARRWYRLLGHAPLHAGGVTRVATPAHPTTWDANFAFAAPGTDPADLLATLQAAALPRAWSVVIGDALSEPAIEAALALAGYTLRGTTIEMLATGPIASPRPLPSIATRTVASADDWATFEALVRADMAEGERTGEPDAAVAEGLWATMRARAPFVDYRLIQLDGVDVGYGLCVACPGRLGLIEELFTTPEARGRGVMSAFIVDTARRLRADGCDAVFLDAHADAAPKQLYARLGFNAVALQRTWARQNLT